MPEAHLTSVYGQRFSEGVETASYEVSSLGFLSVAERAERIERPEMIDLALCDWYTSYPRISPPDIISKKITPVSEGRLLITLEIKRGPIFLASLLPSHDTLLFRRGERYLEVSCSCHPGKNWKLRLDSLPEVTWRGDG